MFNIITDYLEFIGEAGKIDLEQKKNKNQNQTKVTNTEGQVSAHCSELQHKNKDKQKSLF